MDTFNVIALLKLIYWKWLTLKLVLHDRCMRTEDHRRNITEEEYLA